MMPRRPLLLFGLLQLVVAVVVVVVFVDATIWEPFPDLFDYNPEGNLPQLSSPDPLVRFTWNEHVNQSQLQVYRVDRVAAFKVNGSISGTMSLLTNSTTNLLISGSGQLLLDFGVERAAWLEFTSPDLDNDTLVKAAISEFNSPQKTLPVIKYGNNMYRLETNKELYEGVRFVWLYFPQVTKPWHITELELVAKIKPISYTGSFRAYDKELTETWYTGAYAVRLNMEADAFNSVLVERGDRVAIQGDGHPTMAAALVAFSPWQLVKDMLDQTNSGYIHGHQVVDQNIMAYPIYWTMSVNDWFMATGNVSGFVELAPDCMSIVQKRVDDFLQNPDIVWMGWDDRISNGWCFDKTCNREAHLAFAGLVIRACRDLAQSLRLAGMTSDAQRFQDTAFRLLQLLKQVSEWPHGFGLFAAANAINTGMITVSETLQFFESALNDSVNICSWSPFNQYWILQALGNADKIDHAVASIKLCWGPMLKLGKGCFWEIFSPEWAAFMKDGDKAPTMPSYCHPWSSGVTAWLSNVLGGVQPLLPGYAEYVAVPHVSARNPSVSTTVSTPAGPIAVNATLGENMGKSVITIMVKAAVPGFVGIRKRIAGIGTPGCSMDAPIVLVDGMPLVVTNATDIASVVDAGRAAVALGEHFVPSIASSLLFVRIPASGSHIISVRYNGHCQMFSSVVPETTMEAPGIPHFPPFPVPKYPAMTHLDLESQGDGIARHGADGYVLFAFLPNGTDLIQLPSYIHEVTVHNHGFDGWTSSPRSFIGSSGKDKKYLADPRHKGARALGVLMEDVNNRGSLGVIVDINVKNTNEPVWISLYFVSNQSGDKHAIRAMDQKTMNVIAPDGFISNYGDGVWWSIHYNRSVRLRIMSIYGLQVSAVAFSEETHHDASAAEQYYRNAGEVK